MFYDGIIIDSTRKSVICYFRQYEMPLYSLSPGQITPQGEVLAFGLVNKGTISRVVTFCESTKRFESLKTIFNKLNYTRSKIGELWSRKADLEQFERYPRPIGDKTEVKERPTQITALGDEYSGEWNSVGKRHGFGVCVFAVSLCLYEGYWKDDRPHGRGRLILSDITVVEGTFIDGLIIRQWTDKDGNEYDGNSNL